MSRRIARLSPRTRGRPRGVIVTLPGYRWDHSQGGQRQAESGMPATSGSRRCARCWPCSSRAPSSQPARAHSRPRGSSMARSPSRRRRRRSSTAWARAGSAPSAPSSIGAGCRRSGPRTSTGQRTTGWCDGRRSMGSGCCRPSSVRRAGRRGRSSSRQGRAAGTSSRRSCGPRWSGTGRGATSGTRTPACRRCPSAGGSSGTRRTRRSSGRGGRAPSSTSGCWRRRLGRSTPPTPQPGCYSAASSRPRS